jgi:hypothetical protein
MKVTYGAIVQRASGRFGGTVHSNWKGIDVVRRFKSPANPDTAQQRNVRRAFSNLTKSWTLQSSDMRAAWDSFAVGKSYIARNRWLGLNVPVLEGQTDLALMVATPGDASTIPPAAVVFTPAAGEIEAAVTAPTTPDGWTLVSAIVVCCQEWDPTILTNTSTLFQWYTGFDNAAPYTPTALLLPAGTYFAAAFLNWLAPDGLNRYSASISTNGVVVP